MCSLQGEPDLAEAYDAVVRGGRPARTTAIICIIEMFAALNKRYLSFRDR